MLTVCPVLALIDFTLFLAMDEFSYASPEEESAWLTSSFSTHGALWYHSIPLLGRCVPAVGSPLFTCVRATAKQQPGKVFPGGSKPEVFTPWLLLICRKTWVLVVMLSQSPLSTLACLSCWLLAVAYTTFSLLQQCIFDGKCLCNLSLATNVLCFAPTAPRVWMGKK